MIDRDQAARLDEADSLKRFREEFVIADDGPIYMDGNSLGRPPRAALAAVRALMERGWAVELVSGWHEWIDLPARIGDKIASFIGASAGEVVVSDSTSVNLYKLCEAACRSLPGRRAIVTESENFPSDLYILQSIAADRGLEIRYIDTEEDLSSKLDGSVALVCLSHVGYRSGRVWDMNAATEAAHQAGAIMLWDLCHSAGAVPVDLRAAGADLAVGCTYKYLNGGPGSPSYLFVAENLQDELVQPIWGWFGQKDQFAMAPRYEPAKGIQRFLVGTPPILSLAAVEPGIDLTIEASVEAIRSKSLALTDLVIDLADRWLAPFGVDVATPRTPQMRGSHVALRHPDAYKICRALIDAGLVVPDFREPDVIRYGIAPLYTRFVDAWDAVDHMRTLLESGSYASLSAERSRVT